MNTGNVQGRNPHPSGRGGGQAISRAAADRVATGAKRVTLTEEHTDGTHRVTVERVDRTIKASSLSPVKPEDLTDAERERLQLVKPETIVMLTQLPDGSYDLRGHGAVICGMCFEVFIGNAGAIRSLKQRHLSFEHDLYTPLLPDGPDHAVVA